MSANPDPEPPLPDTGAVREFYNKFSAERSASYARTGNPRIGKAIARILPLVRVDSQILELGCGTGLVTEQIARVATRGFVYACDISDSAVALAREHNKASNVQFRALDIITQFEALRAWLPKPVDHVLMIDLLEHIPLNQHQRLFHNLAAIMKSDSAVALTFPSPEYQRYLREQHPEELQIIDEIIELPHLYETAASTGFAIKHFSLEDVWLPKQYVHCILIRTTANCMDRSSLALSEIASQVPPGEKFILVDQDEWAQKAPEGRTAIPFLERDGVYWGPPADEATALRECKRLQEAGAGYIVFGWPAFWWLEHYSSFHQHLLANFSCLMRNERVVIFRLR